MMELTKDIEERIMQEDDGATKLFLFREFAKLEELRVALEDEQREIAKEKNELVKKERQIAQDTKTLQDKELFFEKKMQILKDGYQVLDEDRRRLEIERSKFETEKKRKADEGHPRSESYRNAFSQAEFKAVPGFYAGVTNLLALKKRYKDLLKIYHPDNCSGDNNTLLLIKDEYQRLLNMYER